MDLSKRYIVPSWPVRLEYHEGWLDAKGNAKTRSGALDFIDLHDWLNLEVG